MSCSDEVVSGPRGDDGGRETLRAKVDGIHAAIAGLEEKLAALPFNRESETLRAMLVEMLERLKRVDAQLRDALEQGETMDSIQQDEARGGE